MANVSVMMDGKAVTVAPGQVPHPILAAAATTTNAVPRLHIPALNQTFSAGDNVTIAGGEVITSGLK